MEKLEFKLLQKQVRISPPNESHSTIKRDYEYKRLGTISLLASEAVPLVNDTHNSKN